jgi:exopolysaccharide production protein ExoZ
LITLFLLLGGLVVFGDIFTSNPSVIVRFYTSSIILEFAIGAFIGFLYTRDILVPYRAISLLMLAGCVLALAASESLQAKVSWFSMRVLPASLIVYAVVSLNDCKKKASILAYLGDASYSIYLSHFITLSAMSQIWRALGFGSTVFGKIAFCCVAFPTSLAVGALVYEYAERALTTRIRARIGRVTV